MDPRRAASSGKPGQGIRVLHVLDTDQYAGTEAHVLTLMASSVALGARPVLACRVDGTFTTEAVRRGLAVEYSFGDSKHGGAPTNLVSGLYRAVRRVRPDVVHAHNGRTMLATALTGLLTNVGMVGTQHFIDPQFVTYPLPKRFVAAAMHRWVNGRLAHIIAVSEAARQAMMLRENVPSDRITTVHNGIPRPRAFDSESLSNLRNELGLAPTDIMALTVARLSTEKRVEDLIRAIPAVLRACPHARFFIVGDGAAKSELEAMAALNGRVTFLGFRRDVEALMAAADLFVLPSNAEPFGLVLVEAMAQSKAVVSANSGGPLEIGVDGVTGLLVPPMQPEALAIAISRLAVNSELRNKMGREGNSRYREHFTAERMTNETLAVYRRVLCRQLTTAPKMSCPD